MRRASYKAGVQWIADNDNAGDPERLDAEDIAGYISTLLLADLFGVMPSRVAGDVVKIREKADASEKQLAQDCRCEYHRRLGQGDQTTMTRDDQKELLQDLAGSIVAEMCAKIDAGKVPEEWDGIELRQWFIDQARVGASDYLQRKENRRRAKEYRAVVYNNGL